MVNTLKAVFFDRDGVLMHDHGYVADPQHVELITGVVQLLQSLQSHGVKMFIATNQSGVARGYFPLTSVHAIHDRLFALLGQEFFSEVMICPHHPNGTIPEFSIRCECRKPASGMIEPIMRKYFLQASQCCFIGDTVTDIQAANAAGIRGYLFQGGNIRDWFEEIVLDGDSFEFG